MSAPDRSQVATALDWAERGMLYPTVEAVFAVSDSARAVARACAGEGLGAVVLRVDE